MKKIEAIIRPEKLEVVRQALEKAGITGLMVTEIEGHGKQKGVVQQWRGEKYRVELLPKIKLETVVPDAQVQHITSIVVKAAQTGEIGDGKIFVYPVTNAIRIRTAEEGEGVV